MSIDKVKAAPLLASQRASIFDTIAEQGFDPREFSLETDLEGQPVVLHARSGFWFRITEAANGRTVYFSPGYDKVEDAYGTGAWDNVVVPKLPEWLRYLRREIESVDPWDELERDQQLADASAAAGGGNTPFTPEEQLLIKEELKRIGAFVRDAHQLSDDQFQALENRLDHIAESAARMGRFDWRNAFIGILLTLVVEAVLPPPVVRETLTLALRGLGSLFGEPGMAELPGVPPGTA